MPISTKSEAGALETVVTIAQDGMVGVETLTNWVSDWMKCSNLKLEYLIAMLPGGKNTLVVGLGGAADLLAGKLTVDSYCTQNVLIIRGLFLAVQIAWDVYSFMDDVDPTPSCPVLGVDPCAVAFTVAKWTAFGVFLGSLLSAFGVLLGNYIHARIIANDADVCLSDENHPFPYTDQQVMNLLSENDEQITQKNIDDKNDKICLKYNGRITWLRAGECTATDSDPICAINMRGYSRVLGLVTPKACPCIINIKYGIMDLPDFKRNSDGSLQIDSSGMPQLTVDWATYKSSFLRNVRILRAPTANYDAFSDPVGVIDETCYIGGGILPKGVSKRNLSISGGMVQCFYNTARNIFEKPIFRTPTNRSSTNVTQNYEYDLSIIETTLSSISQIMQNELYYSNLSISQKNGVYNEIQKLLNSKVQNICYVEDSSDSIQKTTQKISFLQKYQSTCSATSACFVSIGSSSDINNINLSKQCYQNNIDDKTIQNTQLMEVLNNLTTYPNTDVRAALNQLKSDIIVKQQQESTISDLKQVVGKEAPALKFTLFDRFNNQIKLIATILISFWLVLLGYRILRGEVKLDQSALIEISTQIGVVYFLVFTNIWKDFLFSFLMRISQTIGIFAMYVTSMSSPLKDKSCNYGVDTKMPYNGIIYAADGSQRVGLKCDPNYTLECTKYDSSTGSCSVGQCKTTLTYIPKLNYEYPYMPVNYYDNQTQAWKTVPMYCEYSDGTRIEASKKINDQLANTVFYCPDANSFLVQGYLTSDLRKLGLSSSLNNYTNDSIFATGIKTTDQFGNIKVLDIVTINDTKELGKRYARRYNAQIEANSLNRKRGYPILKTNYGIERDNSYVQFFDSLDCKVMRFAMIGLGNSTSNSGDFSGNIAASSFSDFDPPSIASFLGGAVNMMFFAFPFGLLISVVMVFISFTLLMIMLKTVQSYVISMFGLVFYVYISPLLFSLSLFPRTAKAREVAIKNIVAYAVSGPLSFFSLGIYITIVDIAFFGNPVNYPSLFALDGSILSNCYTSADGSLQAEAPLACITNKILSNTSLSSAITNIVLILTFTIAASQLGSSTGLDIGAGGGLLAYTIISSLSNASALESQGLLLPFLIKLVFALVLIMAGMSFLDSFEKIVKGMTGLNADLSGGISIPGGSDIASGLKSGASSLVGGVAGKIGGMFNKK